MIELKNVCKAYGSNILFQDVSFLFKDGHKYLIKGDNGVGKSVLLKLIVGYASVNQGVLLEDGKTYEFLRNAGVSINAPEFIDHLSGIDNLLELAKIRKMIKKDEILVLGKCFELDLTKKYKTYSLGMRQKLRLIQAIMEKPRYLILDEPFDGLDSKMKVKVKAFLDNYIQEDPNRILIYTSHDEQAAALASDILVIMDGQLCLENDGSQ